MAASNTSRFRAALERLTPRQRQYGALAGIMACGIGALWAIFAFSGGEPKLVNSQPSTAATTATNIGVMAPGQQVNPIDQWVGTAGRKLAQYEQEREEQTRINRDRKEFEDRTMQRFGELEQRLTKGTPAQPAAATAPPILSQPVPAAPKTATPPSTLYPPSNALPTNLPPPPGRSIPVATTVTGTPLERVDTIATALVHVSMGDAAKSTSSAASTPSSGESAREGARRTDTVDTYLPVSFTRGVLLGGLDAPTGGQAQANPHPVLIRLSDNSVLPNRFRGEYRECFVIAAGYGDISSERAYLRTENLSCVREDGSTLEVKIQGSVYGEDGKVGMRGRLVTKQGQMLANALFSGIASGLGQGLATRATSFSTSALGTIATTSGTEAYRAGLGTGVGRALDRLAQYYIRLAEQTFPVVEIDAGRDVDVVITKGVRIDAPLTTKARPTSNLASTPRSPEERHLKESDNEDY